MARTLKPHAIMIPIPHQGHINPSVNLALMLASHGFAVTFVNTEVVQQMLSESHDGSTANEFDLFEEARESGLDLRCATISDGFPLEYDRVLNINEYWAGMLQGFPALVDEFVGKTIQSEAVHFLVADTIYAWPAAIAKKYNLVNVSVWTEPALVFSLIYHAELMREKGHFPCKENEEIDYIPGIDSINTRDFMPYLKESDVTTTPHKLVFAGFKEAKKADFILHNTVQELEHEIISALNKCQPNYAVGPLNFSKNLPTNAVRKNLLSETDCTGWLDSKPQGSVLYVSFGSLAHTSKQIIEEMANGLLLSGVNFIWVVRDGILGSDDSKVLPDGFQDKIEDKGLIIPWCDQISVLSNPAIGGFLTHCGWNSILESVWCGVPMICYPITYDQPTNRKLVVDDWKIGVNLCDEASVDRNEVAEKIRRVMSGDSSKALTLEMVKVREKLHDAVEVDGSSERNFNQFVKDLKAKIDVTVASE